mgnify:CR=1 FL=1
MNAWRPLALAAIAVGTFDFARAAAADDVATLAAWWPGIYDTSEQLVFSRHGEAGRTDEELASLGSELDDTTVAYGTLEVQAEVREEAGRAGHEMWALARLGFAHSQRLQ